MSRILASGFSFFVSFMACAEVRLVTDLPPDRWIQDSIEILDSTRTERGIEIPAGTVRVANSTPERMERPLLVLENPELTSKSYAIVGEVFHVDVEDEGYLETWNHFRDDGPFFTRTMSEFGPMRWLANTSMGFREFSLPFQSTGQEDWKPTKIELNLILPSTGRVYLRNLRLVEYTGSTDPHSTPGEWWSPVEAGKVGGVLGAIGGLLGTLIGLCGPLMAKGKAKGVTLGVTLLLVTIGFFQSLTGIIAFFGGQPRHVYSPLLLTGPIEFFLGVFFVVLFGRRYAQTETGKRGIPD